MTTRSVAISTVILTTLAIAAAFPAAAEDVQSGTLTMSSWKVAFIGSAGQSKGVLSYGGKSRKFKMTGLGIGGVGLSSSDATGIVYNMKSADDFLGTYSSGRSGVTVGGEIIKDKMLWLKNEKGVKIKLKTTKEGLELNLGTDGSVVVWDD
jgi:hypothetical protein